MIPAPTRGATTNAIAPENWDEAAFGKCEDLSVRVDVFETEKTKFVTCSSTWKPTDEELVRLNAGGVVEVGLCILNQPVMCVGVVEPIDADIKRDAVIEAAKAAPHITINEEAHGDDYNGTHAFPDEN